LLSCESAMLFSLLSLFSAKIFYNAGKILTKG
jgi:hypothetical protein